MVDRYRCYGWDIRRGEMRREDDGDYVSHSDYAALENRFVARIEDYDSTIASLQEQVETLTREKERFAELYAREAAAHMAYREAAGAERDRLREALKEIGKARPELKSVHDYSRGWNDALFRVSQIANAALQKETQP